jgi:hypothetical protein
LFERGSCQALSLIAVKYGSSDMSGILIFAGAMVSTVALLAIGLAVGYRFGMQAGARIVTPAIRPVAAPANNELAEQLRICREVSSSIQARCQAVSDVSLAHRERLPEDLQQAIEALLEATKVLGKQLGRIGAVVAPNQSPQQAVRPGPLPAIESQRTAPAAEPTPLVGRHMRLTGDEIFSLTSLAGSPSNRDEDIHKRRYSYDCRQTVYLWHENDENGPISPGIAVRCHDIAVQGISFFWPDAPDFERLIVTLGSNERPVYMAAEVVQSKAVYMHGEVGFLVGCRFTGRVPEFSEQGRVQLNVRRTRPSMPTAEKAAEGSLEPVECG